MFLRGFNRNRGTESKSQSILFTLLLGVIIFGYFYLAGQQNRIRYPYCRLQENRVYYLERQKAGCKDTVSLLCRRVNRWRYWGVDLGLYDEGTDSLVAQFTPGRNYLTAVVKTMPFYDLFDRSGQSYGISLYPATIADTSRWTDANLGLWHRVRGHDSLEFGSERLHCLLVETGLTAEAIEIIRHKLIARKDPALPEFERICHQVWLNWYSREHGWLKSVYPDGRALRVVAIEDIWWLMRLGRWLDFGVKKGRLRF